MNICIDKSFEKDTDKIRDKNLLNHIADCIEDVRKAENLNSIKNIKKLKGSNKYYRIKIKDYRIGIEIQNNNMIFI
ncbi:MAG: type II toxin-antitoxin system RelE/ParE family toxin [Bacteroidota bacterium]|nr:type II toxin-antitoxin system RelE/ParE family toxin [Bacteroidota bacterium]